MPITRSHCRLVAACSSSLHTQPSPHRIVVDRSRATGAAPSETRHARNVASEAVYFVADRFVNVDPPNDSASMAARTELRYSVDCPPWFDNIGYLGGDFRGRHHAVHPRHRLPAVWITPSVENPDGLYRGDASSAHLPHRRARRGITVLGQNFYRVDEHLPTPDRLRRFDQRAAREGSEAVLDIVATTAHRVLVREAAAGIRPALHASGTLPRYHNLEP